MLSLWKSPRSSKSSDSSDESVAPVGTPYLTKVNGKLVMARKTYKKKPAGASINLLGGALGVPGRIVRKRAKSVDGRSFTSTISLESGDTIYVPKAQPQLPHAASFSHPAFVAQPAPFATLQPPFVHSSPLPQTGFQPFAMPPDMLQLKMQVEQLQMQVAQMQMPQLHPGLHQAHPNMMGKPQSPEQPQPATEKPAQMRYKVDLPPPQPTKKDFEDLVRMEAHFNSLSENENKKPEVSKAPEKHPATPEQKTEKDKVEATVKIDPPKPAYHVCGACGNIRSRKYHFANPIKPGETPLLAFCAKCQKDASSTSSSGIHRAERRDKGKAKHKQERERKEKDVDYIFVEEEISESDLAPPRRGYRDSEDGKHQRRDERARGRERGRAREHHAAARDDSEHKRPQLRVVYDSEVDVERRRASRRKETAKDADYIVVVEEEFSTPEIPRHYRRDPELGREQRLPRHDNHQLRYGDERPHKEEHTYYHGNWDRSELSQSYDDGSSVQYRRAYDAAHRNVSPFNSFRRQETFSPNSLYAQDDRRHRGRREPSRRRFEWDDMELRGGGTSAKTSFESQFCDVAGSPRKSSWKSSYEAGRDRSAHQSTGCSFTRSSASRARGDRSQSRSWGDPISSRYESEVRPQTFPKATTSSHRTSRPSTQRSQSYHIGGSRATSRHPADCPASQSFSHDTRRDRRFSPRRSQDRHVTYRSRAPSPESFHDRNAREVPFSASANTSQALIASPLQPAFHDFDDASSDVTVPFGDSFYEQTRGNNRVHFGDDADSVVSVETINVRVKSRSQDEFFDTRNASFYEDYGAGYDGGDNRWAGQFEEFDGDVNEVTTDDNYGLGLNFGADLFTEEPGKFQNTWDAASTGEKMPGSWVPVDDEGGQFKSSWEAATEREKYQSSWDAVADEELRKKWDTREWDGGLHAFSSEACPSWGRNT